MLREILLLENSVAREFLTSPRQSYISGLSEGFLLRLSLLRQISPRPHLAS